MRFASLGSGSRGNATVVQAGTTTLLIDCGFLLREAEARLARVGLVPADLSAILVTHEHADHIGGVARLARKHHIPVWMTSGTFAAWDDPIVPRIHRFNPHQPFTIGDIEVQPYPVPHDAREPSHFVFGDGARKLGVLSDAGSVTVHMRERLSGCDGLFVESNHDERMLADGPYTVSLKTRIASPLGHLSNAQTGMLLKSIDLTRIQHLVLAHLSETNNTPECARQTVAGILGCAPDWLGVAHQDGGLEWRALG